MKKFQRKNKINFVDDFNTYLGVVLDVNMSFFLSNKIILNDTPFKSCQMVKHPQQFDKCIGDDYRFDPEFKIDVNIKDGLINRNTVIFRLKSKINEDKYIHLSYKGGCDNWYVFESLGVSCKK